jgi:hypothetical protein
MSSGQMIIFYIKTPKAIDCISRLSTNPESDSSPLSSSFFFLVLQVLWPGGGCMQENQERCACGCRAQSTIHSSCRKPIKGSHGFPEAAARMSLIGWCSDIPALRLFQNAFFRQWLVVVRESECLLGCLLSFQLRGSRINPITHGVTFALQSQHRPEVKGKICNKPSQMEFSRHQRRTDGAETMDRCCPLKVQLTTP